MSKASPELTALMNGYHLIFETLIRKLSASGLLSQKEVADELGKLAKDIEIGWKDAYASDTERLDVSVVRQLSRSLREGQAMAPKWGYGAQTPSDLPANDGGDPGS
ncbi:MAG: hypothetical protein E5X76_18185 [Mesorhizobium sp.]|nr:MAG: hypothetical protein E5X76_18185 [Mesorhizobium sp.]